MKDENTLIISRIIEIIDFLLDNKKFINYKGKYSKKKIDKSEKHLKEFKKKLEKGEITLEDLE